MSVTVYFSDERTANMLFEQLPAARPNVAGKTIALIDRRLADHNLHRRGPIQNLKSEICNRLGPGSGATGGTTPG